MATVDMTSGTAGFVSGAPYSARPYVAEIEVDFAAAATAKGSALASSDVIEVLDLPANAWILCAGAKVTEAHAGTSTDLTLDIGLTGGNTDFVADGFDFDGASVGDETAPVVAELPLKVGASADTIDVLLATMTGTTTGGKLLIWATIVEGPDAGYSADEVDRDQLA